MNATEKLADPSFGHYMLNGLREITLPDPPSYRPQTLGWAILAGLALVGLAIWVAQRHRQWRRNRYRRAALQQLTELERRSQHPTTQTEALQNLAELLKRTALVAYPREQVAQLSGESWLSFLDATYSGTGFTRGDGHLLSQLPYQPPDAIAQRPAEAVAGLIAVCRQWIVLHRQKE